MSAPTFPGSQRLKLIAIPILGLVLLSRVWPTSSPTSDADAASSRTNVTEPAAPPSGAAARAPSVRTWPKTELADLLQHNPFGLPAALSPPPPDSEPSETERPKSVGEPSKNAATVAQAVSLESRRVSMVLVSPHGAAAVVDSKLYRLHDFLEPGVQITEIRPNSVIVTRQAPKEAVENRQNRP